MMNRRNMFVGMLVLVLILSSIACKYIVVTPHMNDSGEIVPPDENSAESARPSDDSDLTTSQGTSNELSLITDHVYATSAAIYYIGLLKNDSREALRQIQIELELFDADGNIITQRTIYPFLSVVQPGDILPFQAVFLRDEIASDNGPFKIRGHVVDAVRDTTTTYYHDLVANNVDSLLSTSGDYLMTMAVTASLENTGDRSTGNVKVAFILLDSENRPLRMTSVYVTGKFAPGESQDISTSFQEYSPFDDLPLANRIIVFAEGR